MPTPMTGSKNREICWKARDLYLACLNTRVTSDDFYNAIKKSPSSQSSAIIPTDQLAGTEECTVIRDEMYSKCPESWVNQAKTKQECCTKIRLLICLLLCFF